LKTFNKFDLQFEAELNLNIENHFSVIMHKVWKLSCQNWKK